MKFIRKPFLILASLLVTLSAVCLPCVYHHKGAFVYGYPFPFLYIYPVSRFKGTIALSDYMACNFLTAILDVFLLYVLMALIEKAVKKIRGKKIPEKII